MLVITPKDLKEAVARVKPATDARSAVRVFGALRFVEPANGQPSYIEASTHEGACRRVVPNESMAITAGLDALVHVTYVDKVLKVFAKANEITVRPGDDGTTVFSAGTRKVVAPAEASEDWLKADFHGGPRLLLGQAKDMAGRLAKAITYASKDDTRPHLCTVALDLHPSDWPTWVATDSYRLGLFPASEHDESLTPDEPETHAINVFGLTKVAKSMKTAETVELYMPPTNEGTWYVFVLDGGRELWQIRKTEGRYPNWRQLIPDADKWEVELRLPREPLVSAVEASKVIAERNAPMRLVVNGNVRATVVQPDTAQFEETIDGATVEYLTNEARVLHDNPTGVEYGYNPDFLADCAKTIGAGGEIRVRMITPLRPVLMDADGDRALLMPIRINV
jgi:DNA polymerase III sliding clamp (beta) subunit (PCNA family)